MFRGRPNKSGDDGFYAIERAFRRHAAEALATLIRLTPGLRPGGGGVAGGVRGRGCRLDARDAGQSAGVAGHHRAAEGDRRRPPSRCLSRQDRGAEDPGRDRGRRRGRRGGRDVRRRRHAAPGLHLLPPGAQPGGAGGADAAHRLLAADAGGRPRLPGQRGDDGPAAGAGEGQDPHRRHPLPDAAEGAAGRARRRGAGGDLPGVHRGLRRRSAAGAWRPRRSGWRGGWTRCCRGAARSAACWR